MVGVGSSVGHIRLEALLGAGGMGEVYRGFDEKLQRVVAVKTIRAEHRLSEDTKARFLREARILSKLAHPAICQVFDIIETDEADWLVIEFVEGQTLEALRRSRPLGETEVLELALKIADALVVAHRERIVHRDLKPDNVMVTPTGAVKILDFGIARAVLDGDVAQGTTSPATALEAQASAASHLLDGDATIAFDTRFADPEVVAGATANTQLTQAGWILGTARYMSPEQASGGEVGEPSDLFSFGILLQELLTGKSAYRDAPLHQLLALVMGNHSRPIEGVDPDVARFVEDLKHPLPARRPTAAQAAERLRWLLDRPERERKRRLKLAAATAAFVVLLVVLVVVSVLAVRAQRARDRAEDLAAKLEVEVERANREAATANAVAKFLEGLFGEADPDQARGREVTARDLVTTGASEIGQDLDKEPLVQARLELVLGRISEKLGDYDLAASLYQRATEKRAALLGPTHRDTLETDAYLGAVAVAQSRFEDAHRLLDRVGDDPGLVADAQLQWFVLNQKGILAANEGRGEEAIGYFEAALALREGGDAEETDDTLNNLAILAWQVGDFDRAARYQARAVDLLRGAEGDDHPALVAHLNTLGLIKREQGRLVEAEAHLRDALALGERVLGVDHPDVAFVLASLGRLLTRLDRPAEALPLLERAATILERTLGGDHQETAIVLIRLGEAERQLGSFEAARLHLSLGEQRLRQALGPDHPRLAEAATATARLEAAIGDEHASDAYRRAISLAVGAFGEEHSEVLELRAELAVLIEEKEP